MPDIVVDLEMPASTPHEAAKELIAELKKLDGIHNGAVTIKRSIDPVSLMAWIKLAGAAIPVITAVVGWIRGKGMKNVKLKLGNDVSIEVDSASAADIARLSEALEKRG